MIIKTKKRGEIEVGGDDGLESALSAWFGTVLDEMYDLTVNETTITMWPDDLTVCVAIGGDTAGEDDFKTVPLKQLIREAISCVYDEKEREGIKAKLLEIANEL